MRPTREQQEANEAKFEAAVLDYITNQHRYRYGGIVNIVGTVSSICRDLALKHDCPDYETAADAFDSISEAVNLGYYHQEE